MNKSRLYAANNESGDPDHSVQFPLESITAFSLDVSHRLGQFPTRIGEDRNVPVQDNAALLGN